MVKRPMTKTMEGVGWHGGGVWWLFTPSVDGDDPARTEIFFHLIAENKSKTWPASQSGKLRGLLLFFHSASLIHFRPYLFPSSRSPAHDSQINQRMTGNKISSEWSEFLGYFVSPVLRKYQRPGLLPGYDPTLSCL